MIEICAIGALRVTAALWNAGKLASDGTAKIAYITSQGGSIGWRDVQNAPGPNFGANYGLCTFVKRRHEYLSFFCFFLCVGGDDSIHGLMV